MKYNITSIELYDTLEQLGTKEKFWFYEKGQYFLCKLGRPSTGENWAEVVSFHIATALGIPCASYGFSSWRGKEGVLSPSFVPDYCRLIHGNELLVKYVDYPETTAYKVREYKLSTVLALMRMLESKGVKLPIGFEPEGAVSTIGDMFVGYLMLDALISNQDRHHQNWGMIEMPDARTYTLAPTYDHASSLGCRVSEGEIRKRLSTTDKRFTVAAFVSKAKTPFFGDDNKRLKPVDAFHMAAERHRGAALAWLEKLNHLSESSLQDIFKRIPDGLISEPSIDFALQVIKENKSNLLDCEL
ncbi:HipA domain-containing protein [Desulfoluna spongiiphila]|uniref:HipA-like protein n=1 Tax=Desulfoluna spongiiphila TaxID=419481 RepID=UPI00125707CA|nr:HipA-like protein [Desulfoluna spongiiphila]VVS93060.1 hypothetical protein DBB_26280 [Desulfoluna spongiiphila]